MANLHLGQHFSSFLEFQNFLTSYENENFVKFYKRNSRKIESAVQSGKTKVELNPDLIYYEIKYNCVRGGAFQVQGKGIRKTSSRKIECPAYISLRAAADGKSLEVKSYDDTHNHEVSKALFDHMSQQRRLSGSQKEKARELLSLQANKKLIQQKLQEETGKIITLRDLSNLAKGVKSNSNDLHEAVSLPQGKYDIRTGKETSSHGKRKSSTLQVRNFSEKKRREDEELEEKVMKTQEEIAISIKSVEQKLESVIENQEKLLHEAERTNTILDTISNNLISLVKIGVHVSLASLKGE